MQRSPAIASAAGGITTSSALLIDVRVVCLQLAGVYKLEQRAHSIAASERIRCFVLASRGKTKAKNMPLGPEYVLSACAPFTQEPISDEGLKGCIVGLYDMELLSSWAVARAHARIPNSTLCGMAQYWAICRIWPVRPALPYRHVCGGPYTWASLPASTIAAASERLKPPIYFK